MDLNYPLELKRLVFKLGIIFLKLGLQNNVIFLSYTHDIPCILHNIDVVIHPSVLGIYSFFIFFFRRLVFGWYFVFL
jgi:glycosyltransferase involved in cell wall biosynthesis